MTVGYLKEQLAEYPDDARIMLDCGPLNEVFKNTDNIQRRIEIIDMYSCKDHEDIIFIQTRNDFDYMNELKCKKEYLINCGFENWKEILINQGFTEEEIDKEV